MGNVSTILQMRQGGGSGVYSPSNPSQAEIYSATGIVVDQKSPNNLIQHKSTIEQNNVEIVSDFQTLRGEESMGQLPGTRDYISSKDRPGFA